MAISSSGLLTKSAGNSASRPAGPGTEVRTGWCWASNSFDFIGLLAGASPRSLSSFDWGSVVDVALGRALSEGRPGAPLALSTALTSWLLDNVAGARVSLGDGSDTRAGHWAEGAAGVTSDSPFALLAWTRAGVFNSSVSNGVSVAIGAEWLSGSVFAAAEAGDIAGLDASAESSPGTGVLSPRSKVEVFDSGHLSRRRLGQVVDSWVDENVGGSDTAWDLESALANASDSLVSISINAESFDNSGSWVVA